MNRFSFLGTLILNGILTLALKANNPSSDSLIDDQKLALFAKQIEASIENRDPLYFNLSFNYEALANEIIARYQVTPDSAFNKGFTDGMKSSFDLGTIIINELSSGGSFSYIHTIQRDSKIWLVFRLISNNGVNYHEYKVESVGADYFLTDGYFYLSGDKLSESLSELYRRYSGILQNYTQDDIEWAKSMQELQKAKMFYSEGKSVKAFKRLENLPASYSTTKVAQCARINIAGGLDAYTYLQVFNEFMGTYPDEPGKYLIPLDGLVKHGYYELALKCLDSLDGVLFTDPILNFFRANLCYESGKVDQAVGYLELLLNTMPDLEVAYISLLNIFLAENKFMEATDLLDKIIMTFNAYKEDIYPLLANYPEYLNSPLYQEWIGQ